MDSYQLLWKGRLWTVTVPDDVPKACEWPYVQKYVASGGSQVAAMMFVLQQQYPGLGFGTPSLVPVSVTTPVGADDVSVFGKSSRGGHRNKDSQRQRPPVSRPVAKDAGSDTAGPRKPTPRPATSSASRPLFRASTAGRSACPSSRPPAKVRTAGWMGSAPTSA